MPDKIITVGEIPKKIMERYGNYKAGDIQVSCGLRFEYLADMIAFKRKKTYNIMLALEGIKDVRELVKYVLHHLNKTTYNLLIRTHLVLPWSYFKKKLRFTELGENVSISHETTLKNDLEWADAVIYWGSTVAIEALSVGRPVVHYDIQSIMNYDPLFECEHFKWTANEESDLKSLLGEIVNLPDDVYRLSRSRAKHYLEQYFHVVNEERLSVFL